MLQNYILCHYFSISSAFTAEFAMSFFEQFTLT